MSQSSDQQDPVAATVEKPDDFKARFMQRMADPQDLLRLFEYLPESYFFAKDEDGRFVMCNRLFLERIFGFQDESQLLGKTDFDLVPKELAQRFVDEDRDVMQSEKAFVNRIELVPNAEDTVDWCITTKVPLHGSDGKVIGIAAIMRDYKKAGLMVKPYMEMSVVIEFIKANYQQKIDVKALAGMVNLSVSQFERKFKKLFELTPVTYIMKVRISAACRELVSTDDPISAIAVRSGFYDHSNFTRQFIRHMGMAPKDYRKKATAINQRR
jgi:PAS domain S-box-containing protein